MTFRANICEFYVRITQKAKVLHTKPLNINNLIFPTQGQCEVRSDPNAWINADGRAPLERPHVAKISGTYIAPFDIFISPALTWQSGWDYALTHQAPDADALILIAPVDGEDRFDNQLNLDLRAEKAFIIAERYRIGIIADVFNVFNDDAVTNFFSTRIESTNFGVPRSIVPARFYQVGVRLLF